MNIVINGEGPSLGATELEGLSRLTQVGGSITCTNGAHFIYDAMDPLTHFSPDKVWSVDVREAGRKGNIIKLTKVAPTENGVRVRAYQNATYSAV